MFATSACEHYAVKDDEFSWNPLIETFVTQLFKLYAIFFRQKHHTNISVLYPLLFFIPVELIQYITGKEPTKLLYSV